MLHFLTCLAIFKAFLLSIIGQGFWHWSIAFAVSAKSLTTNIIVTGNVGEQSHRRGISPGKSLYTPIKCAESNSCC